MHAKSMYFLHHSEIPVTCSVILTIYIYYLFFLGHGISSDSVALMFKINLGKLVVIESFIAIQYS